MGSFGCPAVELPSKAGRKTGLCPFGAEIPLPDVAWKVVPRALAGGHRPGGRGGGPRGCAARASGGRVLRGIEALTTGALFSAVPLRLPLREGACQCASLPWLTTV